MAIEALYRLASDWPLARPWHALGLRAPAAAPEMVRRHLKGVVTRKFRAGGAASPRGVPIAHFFSLRSAERGLQRARGTTLGFERPPRRPTRVGDTVRMSPSASLARAGRASRRGEAMHTFFCIATFLLDCTKFFVQLHEIFRAIAAFRCRVLLHTFFSAARFFFGCNIFVSAARNRVSLHTFCIRLGTPRGRGCSFSFFFLMSAVKCQLSTAPGYATTAAGVDMEQCVHILE